MSGFEQKLFRIRFQTSIIFKMEAQLLRRTLYKNARFEVESRIERSRRLTVHSQKENRGKEHFLRRNVGAVLEEATPPQPVAKGNLSSCLLCFS